MLAEDNETNSTFTGLCMRHAAAKPSKLTIVCLCVSCRVMRLCAESLYGEDDEEIRVPSAYGTEDVEGVADDGYVLDPSLPAGAYDLGRF